MIKTVITLLIIICILASISSFLAAKFANQQEILRAREELQDLRTRRDSLLTQIAKKDSLTAVFEAKVSDLNGEIARLSIDRANLEVERRKAEANAFRLFQPEDIMKEMKKHWPEMARSGWGFKEIFNEKYQVEIEYFLIPTQFTTTFIQDHIDALNYKAQRDTLLRLEASQQNVITLQDSIIHLEKEKKEAYKRGYDDAYAKYETLNEKYTKLLENPQIKLGLPTVSTLVGSAAAGFVAGTVITNVRR